MIPSMRAMSFSSQSMSHLLTHEFTLTAGVVSLTLIFPLVCSSMSLFGRRETSSLSSLQEIRGIKVQILLEIRGSQRMSSALELPCPQPRAHSLHRPPIESPVITAPYHSTAYSSQTQYYYVAHSGISHCKILIQKSAVLCLLRSIEIKRTQTSPTWYSRSSTEWVALLLPRLHMFCKEAMME